MPIAIFPSDPMNTRVVDPEYKDEMLFFQKMGVSIALWNMDEPHLLPSFYKSNPVCHGFGFWRGWMLNDEQHNALVAHMHTLGWSHELVNQRLMHTADNWSLHLPSMFPKQIIVSNQLLCTSTIFEEASKTCGVPLFVKSLVKSSGSVKPCFTVDDVNDQLLQIQKLRPYDHGYVLREWLQLNPAQREVRLFYIDGELHGSEQDQDWISTHRVNVLSLVKTIAEANWCSLDFAVDVSNQWWLMEIGDASVTGWKYYNPSDIQNVLRSIYLFSVKMEALPYTPLCP